MQPKACRGARPAPTMYGVDELQPDDVLADMPSSVPPVLGRWIEDAACTGLAEAFLAERPRPGEIAVLEHICGGCPVRVACASYADASTSLGMRGGAFRSARFYKGTEAA